MLAGYGDKVGSVPASQGQASYSRYDRVLQWFTLPRKWELSAASTLFMATLMPPSEEDHPAVAEGQELVGEPSKLLISKTTLK